MMDDEFDIPSEEMDDEDDDLLDGEEVERDSAFDTSEDENAPGADDMEVDEENEILPPPHLRPNAMAEDEEEGEDGQITTNLMSDLAAAEFSLPAVTRARAKLEGEAGGDDEEEAVDFIEGKTSLRDVEARMKWLVGILTGRDKEEGLTPAGIDGPEFKGLKGL